MFSNENVGHYNSIFFTSNFNLPYNMKCDLNFYCLFVNVPTLNENVGI